jgi:hypothetical protein
VDIRRHAEQTRRFCVERIQIAIMSVVARTISSLCQNGNGNGNGSAAESNNMECITMLKQGVELVPKIG